MTTNTVAAVCDRCLFGAHRAPLQESPSLYFVIPNKVSLSAGLKIWVMPQATLVRSVSLEFSTNASELFNAYQRACCVCDEPRSDSARPSLFTVHVFAPDFGSQATRNRRDLSVIVARMLGNDLVAVTQILICIGCLRKSGESSCHLRSCSRNCKSRSPPGPFFNTAPGSTNYTDAFKSFAGPAEAGFKHVARNQPLRS